SIPWAPRRRQAIRNRPWRTATRCPGRMRSASRRPRPHRTTTASSAAWTCACSMPRRAFRPWRRCPRPAPPGHLRARPPRRSRRCTRSRSCVLRSADRRRASGARIPSADARDAFPTSQRADAPGRLRLEHDMIHTSPRLERAAPSTSRRHFVQGLLLGGAALAAGTLRVPAQARERTLATPGQTLAGTDFQLDIGTSLVNFTGQPRPAITINGSLPAPLLRWREGDTVSLRVTNHLPPGTQTSIHWHGILLPANMDGVPGMSFDGILPGESYLYRFALKQSGTYWYHSHSMQQEQAGLYGAIIVDPREPAPYHWDREHVVLL